MYTYILISKLEAWRMILPEEMCPESTGSSLGHSPMCQVLTEYLQAPSGTVTCLGEEDQNSNR